MKIFVLRPLLGEDGYALTLRLTAQNHETFDRVATRVWTLIEAGKKANNLRRVIPEFMGSLGGPWLSFVSNASTTPLEYFCAPVTWPNQSSHGAQITIAFRQRNSGTAAQTGGPSTADAKSSDAFDTILTGYRRELERLAVDCKSDPGAEGVETRHREFLDSIHRVTHSLVELEKNAAPDELLVMRASFQEMLLEFLAGSMNFKHTLVKPLGYAGDFQLLSMLA